MKASLIVIYITAGVYFSLKPALGLRYARAAARTPQSPRLNCPHPLKAHTRSSD